VADLARRASTRTAPSGCWAARPFASLKLWLGQPVSPRVIEARRG
jgi:hypothetical protein